MLALSDDAVAGLIGAGIGALITVAVAVGQEAWKEYRARKAEARKRDSELRLALRTVLDELRGDQRLLTKPGDYDTATRYAEVALDGWQAQRDVLIRELDGPRYSNLSAAYRALEAMKKAGMANVPGRATREWEEVFGFLPDVIDGLDSLAADVDTRST